MKELTKKEVEDWLTIHWKRYYEKTQSLNLNSNQIKYLETLSSGSR